MRGGARIARQLWLMIKKDSRLMIRSFWPLFEVLIPLIAIIVVSVIGGNMFRASGGMIIRPARIYANLPIHGDVTDIISYNENFPRKTTGQNALSIGPVFVKLGYVNINNVTEFIMAEIKLRFNSRPDQFSFIIEKFETRAAMEMAMRNETFFGGIHFEHIDSSAKELSYKFIHNVHPPLAFSAGDEYNLKDVEPWATDEPHLVVSRKVTDKRNRFWKSGLLFLQTAIDSVFIEKISSLPDVSLSLQRLPEPSSITGYLDNISYIAGAIVLFSVVHTTASISAEIENGMMQFLAVMGLSHTVFLASHMLMAYIKISILTFIFAGLCTFLFANASITLWLLLFWLFSIGAVVFASMFATLFNRSKTASMLCLLTWAVLVAVPIAGPPRTDVALCHLASLNINQAFAYAIRAVYSSVYDELTWSNTFDNGTEGFSFGSAILMMVFDIMWMMIVLIVVFSVKTRKAWIYKILRKKTANLIDLEKSKKTTLTMETYTKNNEQLVDIDISGVVKAWNCGDIAVNNLTLQVLRGEITVLLGHNGAGKSTLFSMLSGETKPTQGSLTICGHDMISEPAKCQSYIGYCPQKNVLFDKLSIIEHLKLVHHLKKASTDVDAECRAIVARMNVGEHESTWAKLLSGGMKRKLCMAMAMIGGSRVVLLDEPTEGMDTAARRDAEQWLKEEKQHRTILLTTHYMDEAETLADKVAVMASGALKAHGTLDALKNRFGSGYLLDVVFGDDANVSLAVPKILSAVTTHVPTAFLDFRKKMGIQIGIVLPQDHIDQFPALLAYLEDNSIHLNIISFGLSLNSLEQILMEIDSTDVNTESTEEVKLEQAEKLTGCGLVASQVCALLLKKLYYTRSNIVQLLLQTVLPIVVALIALIVVRTFSAEVDFERLYSIEALGDVSVPVQFVSENDAIRSRFGSLFSPLQVQNVYISASANMSSELMKRHKYLPGIPFAYTFNKTYVTAYFNPNALSHKSLINVLSNTRLVQGGYIKTNVEVIDFEQRSVKSPEDYYRIAVMITFVIALPLITASFIIFPIEEKVTKFKHLQSLTGVSPSISWASCALFDFVLYTLTLSVMLAIFIIGGYSNKAVYSAVLYVAYFFCVTPLVYILSMPFSSSAKAHLFAIAWLVIGDWSGYAAFQHIRSNYLITEINKKLYSMSVMFAIPQSTHSYLHGVMNDKTAEDLFSMQHLGTPLVMMFVACVCSSVLLIVLHTKKVHNMLHSYIGCCKQYENEDRTENVDVKAERKRIHEDTIENTGTRSKSKNSVKSDAGGDVPYTLKVDGLVKCYATGICSSPQLAVDDISFGVKPKECFGLLGTNGAGKTSTFMVLTGEHPQTQGYVTMNGVDVTENKALGFCPQFDALMPDLSGRENLTILAKLHGFKNASACVDNALQLVGMARHADKCFNKCSGGQRRRLSLAAAILAQTDLIILDEPTAGVDPKARREIWQLLCAMRACGTAIVLTSHSMNECEALCTRIAILDEGRMVAIGSAQHLKSRYGKNYCLSLSIPLTTVNWEQKKSEIASVIGKEFGAENVHLVSSSHNAIKWKIARSVCVRWSDMFGRVLKVKTELGVDFCLTQTSLEDTFIGLVEHGLNKNRAD